MLNLTQPTTFGEILNWQIHWLYCDMSELKRLIANHTYNGPEHTIDTYIEKMNHIAQTKLRRAMWETATMIHIDSYLDDKFEAEVRGLEAYPRFLESFNEVKNMIAVLFEKANKQAIDKFNNELNASKLKL